jgi:hypothetical protein
MSDASSLVPWVIAVFGCAVSYVVARLTPREPSFFTVLLAGAKAFALSIVSFFVGSILHGICVDALHRCVTHGEGNIQYAMGGVLAFPIFWLIIVLFGSRSETEPIRSMSDQCDAACSTAILRHVEGKADSTLCPACKQVVVTKRHEANAKDAHVVTRCSCGKCDKRFTVRPSAA